MSFFGTPPLKPIIDVVPPLRARVGVEGDCGLLGTDPSGVRGRPYDTTQAMDSVNHFMPFSPNCVKWIAIPIFKQTPEGSLYQFQALDALGQWWSGSLIFSMGGLYKSSEPGSDDSSWFEKATKDVANAIIEYGIPILAAALAVTGVGVVGAAALLAWRSLAMGSSLTDAVIAGAQAKISSQPSALDSFNQGLARAKAGLTQAAYDAALKALPSSATSTAPQQAFNNAVQLTRSKWVQDLTVGALSGVLSGDEVSRMNLALKWGAPLSDVMTGLRGLVGDKMLASTTDKAAKFVEANVSTPDKIKAATIDKALLRTLAPSDTMIILPSGGGGGGGSSSSGLGVGSVVLVGAGGYALYKFWPKIMHGFSRPGQPKRGLR